MWNNPYVKNNKTLRVICGKFTATLYKLAAAHLQAPERQIK